MYLPNYVHQLRKEKRILAVQNQQLHRVHMLQKNKADKLQDVNDKLKKQINQLEKDKRKLEEELEKTKAERDTYKNLTFKEKLECSFPSTHANSEKKRGGQLGHPGVSRELPRHVHDIIRVYLTNCPDCDGKLNRVDGITTHTITDLPHWQYMQPIATRYQIERQWCTNCRMEVKGVPKGVIPGVRFGSVLITMVLVWKYRFRDPLNKIIERLNTHYGICVSEGGLQRILAKARKQLGSKYNKLINDVRGSPVKHADETSWPVGAENYWAWAFVDPKTTVSS